MSNSSAKWGLFIIIAVSLTVIGATFTGQILAIKESSSTSTDRESFTTVATTTTHHQTKGVKILGVQTLASTVVVGSTFGIRGYVINNSTATITFANGTCNSPVSIDFNENVMSVPQPATTSCKTQQVTLKPGEQSPILSPNLSGITYRATAPGMTNATMTFKYGAVTTTSKSPISDSISRVYTFNIQPVGSHPVTLHPTSKSTPSSQPGVLKATP
jgi:hypothetical protein